MNIRFPVIDLAATGANIIRLRQSRGRTVQDIQSFFGSEEPQAVYKWQRGQCLPNVDNLYALSKLLGVAMDQILVARSEEPTIRPAKNLSAACEASGFSSVNRGSPDRFVLLSTRSMDYSIPADSFRH